MKRYDLGDRMRAFLFTIVILGFLPIGLVRADSDAKKPTEGEVKMLEGTWQLVTGELAGMKFPEEVAKGIRLTLTADRYVVATPDGDDEGTVQLMPDKMPKALDVSGTKGPNKGKTFLAIYEVQGESLTVCYDLEGTTRPTEFKTKPKTKLFLATYKKVKQ